MIICFDKQPNLRRNFACICIAEYTKYNQRCSPDYFALWSELCQQKLVPAIFSAGLQTCLVVWMSFMPLDRFAARLKKRLEKILYD